MHYLPPRLRIRLLNKLFEYTNNDEFDDTTRMRMTWNILDSVTQLRASRVVSSKEISLFACSKEMLQVEPKYWDIAFLPTQRFRGAKVLDVYADSRRKIFD